MKHRYLAACVAFTFVVLVAIAVGVRAQSEPDPDRLAAIYLEAFNARDVSRFALLFADDAVLMPPDTPLIRGRAAIEAAYAGRFPLLAGRRLEMRRLDFDAHGDRATVVGTFDWPPVSGQEVSTGVDGAANAFAGKFMQIYKRVGNEWVIAFQIVNYDAAGNR